MTNNNTMNGDVRACPCRDTFQSDIDTVVTLLDKASKKKGTANYKVRKNIVGNKVCMSLPILSDPAILREYKCHGNKLDKENDKIVTY